LDFWPPGGVGCLGPLCGGEKILGFVPQRLNAGFGTISLFRLTKKLGEL